MAWQTEVEKDRREEDAYAVFTEMLAKRMKDAELFGGERAAGILWSVVTAIKTHPSSNTRLRMTNYLIQSRRFKELISKVGRKHEKLINWWEAVS